MLRRGTKLSTYQRVPYDSNALTYFQTAGITTFKERQAVNNLVMEMKQAGLWQKMDRLYLFSPTSLSAALYDAKNLTQMTAVNSPTFSAAGIALDGSTQYFETGFNATHYGSQKWQLASCHMSVFFGGSMGAGSSGFQVFIGTNDGTTGADDIFDHTALGGTFEGGISEFPGNQIDVQISPMGFSAIARTDGSTVRGYANGIFYSAPSTATANPNLQTYLGARNDSNTPAFFTNNTYIFSSLGAGLSNAEITLLVTQVTRYQRAIGRNV